MALPVLSSADADLSDTLGAMAISVLLAPSFAFRPTWESQLDEIMDAYGSTTESDDIRSPAGPASRPVRFVEIPQPIVSYARSSFGLSSTFLYAMFLLFLLGANMFASVIFLKVNRSYYFRHDVRTIDPTLETR